MTTTGPDRSPGDPTGYPTGRPDDVYRRQLAHDLRHELSTITLIATVLHGSRQMAAEDRHRVAQLLAETKWLEELVAAYDEALGPDAGQAVPPVRADLLAADVLRPIRLGTSARIGLDAANTAVLIERLALWRALRNVICNALDAVGPQGELVVRVYPQDGWAMVEVEDDGPGFTPADAGTRGMGLKITEQIVGAAGGTLEIGASSLGGCRVRLLLPLAGAGRPAG